MTDLLKYGFCFLSIICSLPVSGQGSNNDPAKAEELFAQQHYSSALPLLQGLLAKNPYNAALLYKAGACYLYSRSQQAKAIPLLERAVELSGNLNSDHLRESDPPKNIYRLLAEAYYTAYRFDPAIKAYEKYRDILLQSKTQNRQELEAVNNRIEICRLGKELKDLGSPLPAEIVQEKNNLKNNQLLTGDYSSTLSNDKSTMIVTFKIPVNRNHVPEDFRYFDNSDDNLQPVVAPTYTVNAAEINDTLIYSTTIGASVDGQIVLSYRNENGDAAVYLSRLIKDKWSPPEKICKSANSKGWEPGETISADGNLMLFVSERAGGYGGKDIYMCSRLPDGTWSKAKNIGPQVNTPFDETAPFVHPNGQYLYFSSNRHKPACYEVYVSNRSEGKWLAPANVGYPVNRFDNDIYEVSARKGPLLNTKTPLAGANSKNTDSINGSGLLLTVSDERKASLILIKGRIRTAGGTPPSACKITVSDNSNETVQGVYYSDSGGNFSFFVPAGKSNNIVYESASHLFLSEHLHTLQDQYFVTRKTLVLPALAAGSMVHLQNVFFEKDGALIRPASYTELNRIRQLLQQNREMKAELRHITYAKKDRKAAKKLARERAAALAAWLLERGILPSQLTYSGEAQKPGRKKTGKTETEILKDGDERTTLTIK